MTASELQQVPTPAKSKTSWWAWGIALAVIGVIVLFATRNPSHEPTSDEVRGDAQRVCQEQFIPKRLKAPSTAEFSGVSVTFDGTTYTVAGAVDAQNSFGASMRSPFSCTVHQSADRWVLDSANVAG